MLVSAKAVAEIVTAAEMRELAGSLWVRQVLYVYEKYGGYDHYQATRNVVSEFVAWAGQQGFRLAELATDGITASTWVAALEWRAGLFDGAKPLTEFQRDELEELVVNKLRELLRRDREKVLQEDAANQARYAKA